MNSVSPTSLSISVLSFIMPFPIIVHCLYRFQNDWSTHHPQLDPFLYSTLLPHSSYFAFCFLTIPFESAPPSGTSILWKFFLCLLHSSSLASRCSCHKHISVTMPSYERTDPAVATSQASSHETSSIAPM